MLLRKGFSTGTKTHRNRSWSLFFYTNLDRGRINNKGEPFSPFTKNHTEAPNHRIGYNSISIGDNFEIFVPYSTKGSFLALPI